MTSPTDELRTAAEKLRTLATAASTDNDGTPTAHWHTAPLWPDNDDGTRYLFGDHLTRDDGRRISWPLLLRGGRQLHQSYMHGQHADYAAAMDPTVGLALADWLDTAAEHCRLGYVCCDNGPCDEIAAPALAVARAINGSQP
ncbi:hypothetical protein [Streptomyces sp. NPDC052114]|uniref:hypothetical protein n=1 Tax=unclassified Streptomyces TaxID=2593676 RepID=UPI0034382C74